MTCWVFSVALGSSSHDHHVSRMALVFAWFSHLHFYIKRCLHCCCCGRHVAAAAAVATAAAAAAAHPTWYPLATACLPAHTRLPPGPHLRRRRATAALLLFESSRFQGRDTGGLWPTQLGLLIGALLFTFFASVSVCIVLCCCSLVSYIASPVSFLASVSAFLSSAAAHW